MTTSIQSTDASFSSVEEIGVPLEFENHSDYLFARLFLNIDTAARIPWKFCDTILSTLRDPRFDNRSITFKDCGDMYCQIGQYRDRAWSLVESRPQDNAVFPQVILDGVFDVLEDTLKITSNIRQQ